MAKQTLEEKRKHGLIDELLKDYAGPESFWGESGLFADLKKRIVERALDVEMNDHLGYSKHDPKGNNSGNSRNGRGKKTVVLGTDEVELAPPRDRNGSYEPQLIPKGKRYFKGFNDNIIAMYARGMSVRDIQSCLLEMYQVDVSEGLISQATDGIMEEVKAWQSRPLDEIYPIVFLDCIVVKCRQEGKVAKVSVYLALGVNMDGNKELLTSIERSAIEQMIEDGVIEGGMIPKLRCCDSAIGGGVGKAHVIDGRQEHAILLEIFTDTGIGTQIVEETS